MNNSLLTRAASKLLTSILSFQMSFTSGLYKTWSTFSENFAAQGETERYLGTHKVFLKIDNRYFMDSVSRKTGVGGEDREPKIAESWQILNLGIERVN